MDHTNDTQKRVDRKRLTELLTPSWLSGFIAVAAGLAVTVGALVLFGAQSGPIQQQLLNIQDTSSSQALTTPGQAPPNSGAANSLQNTWPLLAFWGVIGLIVYFVVEAVIKALSELAELKNELDYIHAQRNALLKTTAQNLALRVAAAVLWLVYLDIFFKRIVPYSVTAAYASASNPRSVAGLIYAFLAFVVIGLSMHLHSIFLRLVVRRPRVFSSADYV